MSSSLSLSSSSSSLLFHRLLTMCPSSSSRINTAAVSTWRCYATSSSSSWRQGTSTATTTTSPPKPFFATRSGNITGSKRHCNISTRNNSTFHSSTPLLFSSDAATATATATVTAAEAEASDTTKPFQMPPYKAPTTYEITSDVESIMKDILKLKTPMEYHTVGYILAYRIGMTSEQLHQLIQGGGGEGGGGSAEAAQAETEVVEEKTDFDIKITSFDSKSKIKLIKEVRSVTDMGLKEAKEFVETLPKILIKNIKKEQAEELKTKLETVGAVVELE